MKLALLTALVLVAALVAALALVLAMAGVKEPPQLESMSAADQRLGSGAPVPPYERFPARDGAQLAYRFYPGEPGKGVAIAIHGSSGVSVAVHGVSSGFSSAGIATYAMDLRGHGESGTLGDLAYRGQSEDDLADLVAFVAARHPQEKLLLFGHSLGGAFVLRVAASPLAPRFAGIIASAPILSSSGPTSRPDTGGWTQVSLPRIVVLTLLNRLGISALDGLSVIAYAVPPGATGKRARIYSHRLLASLMLPRDWGPTVASIARPTVVMIGADDALFVAGAYPAAIGAVNDRIPVDVLAGIDHMGMVYTPAAVAATTARATQLLGGR